MNLRKQEEEKKPIYLAQNKFDANIHNELRSLKKSQQQAYWNIINSANGLKDNNVPIDIETLQEHFRNLSQTILMIMRKPHVLNMHLLLRVTSVYIVKLALGKY